MLIQYFKNVKNLVKLMEVLITMGILQQDNVNQHVKIIHFTQQIPKQECAKFDAHLELTDSMIHRSANLPVARVLQIIIQVFV